MDKKEVTKASMIMRSHIYSSIKNLALWARSEPLGSAKINNSKCQVI